MKQRFDASGSVFSWTFLQLTSGEEMDRDHTQLIRCGSRDQQLNPGSGGSGSGTLRFITQNRDKNEKFLKNFFIFLEKFCEKKIQKTRSFDQKLVKDEKLEDLKNHGFKKYLFFVISATRIFSF